MGRSIAKAALKHNDRVCAVGRTFEDSISSMKNWHDDPDRFLGLLCDVRIRETVSATIERALDHFGCIDVVCVCSGCGVIGACEDQEEYEIRDQFETNFMGTLNILQLSLPYFRQRQQGRYLIFSSTSGALGVPGMGPYCATKYAVEGLFESMLYEIDAFNIKVTLVEPGHLRRDDVHKEANGELPIFGHFKVKPPSEPYAAKDSPANHAKRMLQWIGNHQATSAVKTAELAWQLGHCSYPPLRLLCGTFAVESIRDRLKSITEEIEDWKHLNFPSSEASEKPKDTERDDDHTGEDDEDDEENEQDQAQEEGEEYPEGDGAQGQEGEKNGRKDSRHTGQRGDFDTMDQS